MLCRSLIFSDVHSHPPLGSSFLFINFWFFTVIFFFFYYIRAVAKYSNNKKKYYCGGRIEMIIYCHRNSCSYLSLFASSINGLFSISVKSFHSAPNLFDISELCILGFSWAIFLRCPLDHTINAFMGLFMWSWWCDDLLDIIILKIVFFFKM